MSLENAIHTQTDSRYFPVRLYSSVSAVTKKHGYPAGILMSSAITATSVCSFAISYFTMEGSVRALIDLANHEGDKMVGLRPLGDAGGWTCLALFSVIGLGTFIVQLIREGEYIQLKKICKRWIQNNIGEEDPVVLHNLYERVDDLLNAMQTQCLFPKNLPERKIIALKIASHSANPELEPLYVIDNEMKNILTEIKSDMDNVTSVKHYFHRVYDGQRSLARKGCSAAFLTLILGVAIPTILLVCAIMSLIGEVGLGKELFVDREELTDVGHFGEWPLNAVEAVTMAVLLHQWCMVNEGDFVRKREVYQNHIERDHENPATKECLIKFANQELSELSTQCHNFKLPMDYKFN